ncbi:Hypothetical protein A7982_02811 [Minicystis rosea]|nr:Hypothetical protein A7982_02811 [Minicystis rosea]
MGKVIPRSASPERIFGDFETSLKNGRRREGEIAKATDARLGPLQSAVDKAVDDVASDTKTVDELEETLLAADGVSDLEIGAVLDEAWNALGRPASSVEYGLVAGRGKLQWADGDPREQATLMTILAARFRQSTAFALQAGKEGWAKRIEAKAAPQEAIAAKLKAAEAKRIASTGIARTIADLTQVALVRFKRDLQNLGLTEAQIHEIIPDYEPKPKAPPEKKPADGKSTPPDA